MTDNEMAVPMRPSEMAKIKCMVHGDLEIDLSQIKYLRNIRADNDVTCQIAMRDNVSYYIRGKDMHAVGDELGIQLTAYVTPVAP